MNKKTTYQVIDTVSTFITWKLALSICEEKRGNARGSSARHDDSSNSIFHMTIYEFFRYYIQHSYFKHSQQSVQNLACWIVHQALLVYVVPV